MARRSGRRADYQWQAGATISSGVDIATGTATAGNAGIINILAPATISRIHGHIFFQLDTTAVDERVVICYGLIIVSENALGAGVASMPHPFTDAEVSWIAHGFASVSSLAEAAVQPDALFTRVEVDSKAMRKVKPTEQLVLVVESVISVDQAGTWDMMAAFRVLFAD